MKKRILSTILALCMAFSAVATAATSVNAVSVSDSEVSASSEIQEVGANDYGLVDNVQQGQILQCWNWSYNGIKANMQKIAEQGFSAIQTSPIQTIKESTLGKSFSTNWWVYYQPSNFNIDTSSQNALGTKSEFKAMCDEAHKYGVKVIVDAVLNHMANNGDNTLSPTIPDDIRNDSSCWHSITTNTSNWNSRWDITHNCMGGLPDLNTGNSKIQNYEKAFMKECIDAGADGFRFDGAKHLELPNDQENASSNFWTVILGYTTSYAQSTRGFTPYYYGEILDKPAGGQSIVNGYTSLMSVTANLVSDDIRNQVNSGNASGAKRTDFCYNDGSQPAASKAVLWNESHDTYANGASRGISDNVMNKTWALVGSRAEACGMYLARPSNYSQQIGTASVTAWANKEVQAVNQFKNYFAGQTEYLSSSGSIAYNERGTEGVVLVNCGGSSASVNVKANKMKDGTYTDAVTGNTFTVSGGQIKGQIGSTGVAVVYNPKPAGPSASVTPGSKTYNTDTLTLTLSYKNATSGQYSIDGGAYTSYTDGKTITIGSGLAYGTKTTVSVKATDGTTTSDVQTYTYTKADPSQTQKVYFDNSTYNWSSVYAYIYNSGTTPSDPDTPVDPVTPVSGTIQFTDNQGWGDNIYAYFWSDNQVDLGGAWPGTKMGNPTNNGLGQNNYSCSIPSGAAYVVFSNGSDQTVDVTLGGYEGYYTDGTRENGKLKAYGWNTGASLTLLNSALIQADGEADTTPCNAAWPGVKMTLDSASGYYVTEVPEGFENGCVIFTESKDATTNRYPADMEPGLELSGRTMLFKANYAWVEYTPVQPTTQPTTVQPTTAQPTTAQPTTQQATTQPTDKLTVNVTSNVFPAETKTFDKSQKTVTVTFKLTSSMLLINSDWKLSYDNSKLKFDKSKNTNIMPVVGDSVVINSLTSYIKGNFTNLNGYNFTSNKTFVTVTFDVIGTGNADINLFVDTLSVGYKLSNGQTEFKAIVDYGEKLDISGIKGFENAKLSDLKSEVGTGEILIGDVDGDGEITIKDATKIQLHCADLEVLTGDARLAADVDQSGSVNVTDATEIQYYLVGLATSGYCGTYVSR